MAEATNADVAEAAARVQLLESELVDRASQDERRLQRIAAAEQFRSQITAVTDALNRSNEEYHTVLADAERSVIEAEARGRAGGSATRRGPPADAPHLRGPPRRCAPPADDPLTELPNLRETLAAEVDRADDGARRGQRPARRGRGRDRRTQGQLDAHLEVVPTEDIGHDDLADAVDLVGAGTTPVVLDDPFAQSPDELDDLLDRLVAASAARPIVLLTDDPDTLGWAIGLPADVGTVTRLPTPTGLLGPSGCASGGASGPGRLTDKDTLPCHNAYRSG